MRRRRTAGGFTLIEMLVAVGLVALLASLAFPLWELQLRREQERELRRALVEIRSAIDDYKRAYDEGRIQQRTGSPGYPRSLDELALGVPDVSRPDGRKLYFLRRIPRDPIASGVTTRVTTWGIRGYRSPYDAPTEEGEAFDVYSLAPGKGLNGVSYREW